MSQALTNISWNTQTRRKWRGMGQGDSFMKNLKSKNELKLTNHNGKPFGLFHS